ncbi:FecR family protein [Pararobbsia silviterrae]|nr:FecR domain-containing protein [Pararobbsia silviterrae]
MGLWPSAHERAADFRTVAGEQRQIAMTDAVNVEMNTMTAVSRQTVNGVTVGIELVSGEAAIDIHAQTAGFSVLSQGAKTIASAGRFQVRHTGDKTCVSCVAGTLAVYHPTGKRVLGAGQMLEYASDAIGTAKAVDVAALSAWRSGVLVFRRTPLSEVIAEINRYRPGRVVLVKQDVGAREMSGRFDIRLLDVVLEQIQRTYDLDARRLPGGVLLLG